MNKPIKIRLHVLSPIHIGCDDVYEPTSFVIDEQKKKLIEFDPLNFVKSLKPQEAAEFSKTAAGDNLLAIFKMIKRFYKPEVKSREVEVTDYLVNHYKKILTMGTFDKNAVINQFTMNKTAYNSHTNQPYIPGTSLKGSLRTAYLSVLAAFKQIKNFKEKSKQLEIQLLEGDFATDPFRMVKVSDFLPVGDIKTKIVYAVNRKKKETDMQLLSEKGGVYQIFEVIEQGQIFEGVINIDKPQDKSNIKMPIAADNLMKSLKHFYNPLLESEIKMLKSIKINVPIINRINSHFKNTINKKAFLIRIGRHSGAEAVTIEGNRKIKIMQGGGEHKFLDYSTTIWLASDNPKPQNNNGLLPFGWAALEVID